MLIQKLQFYVYLFHVIHMCSLQEEPMEKLLSGS